MCFLVSRCFCISLDVGTKIIGVFYIIFSLACLVLYGVPVFLGWGSLPLSRALFYASLVASSAVLMLASCLLVYAAFKKKPCLMNPWIVTSWCTSVPLAVLCVAGVVLLPFKHPDWAEAAEETCVIAIYLTHAGLLFYFSSVVRSRRRQLEDYEQTEATRRLMFPVMYQANRV